MRGNHVCQTELAAIPYIVLKSNTEETSYRIFLIVSVRDGQWGELQITSSRKGLRRINVSGQRRYKTVRTSLINRVMRQQNFTYAILR
jgi:hypothetical protein